MGSDIAALVLTCIVAVGFITATSLMLTNTVGTSLYYKKYEKYKYKAEKAQKLREKVRRYSNEVFSIPAINSEVQHRRSAISVVRPVHPAGESRRRGGRGVRRREGVARANAPAAAKISPGRRPPGRHVVCPCPAIQEHEPALLAAAREPRSPAARVCTGPFLERAPAGRAGSRVRLCLRRAGPPVNVRLKTSAGVR